MSEEKKITKKEVFLALKEMVEGMEDAVIEGVDNAVIATVLTKAVEQIDHKAEKAKEKAGEKKAEGDALREEVASHLTNELQPIDAIAELVTAEDATKAKVTARLTQLVKAGIARKESIKVGDRKVMGYALAGDEVPAEDAE